MTESTLFPRGSELDRRCEAFAAVAKDLKRLLPIRFREHCPQNQRPYLTLYTRKVPR